MNTNIQEIALIRSGLGSIKNAVTELKTLTAFLGIQDEKLIAAAPAVQNAVSARLTDIETLLAQQESALSSLCQTVHKNAVIYGSNISESETPLMSIGLQAQHYWLLKRADIATVEQLVAFLKEDSLTSIRGCGKVKANAIEACLASYLESHQTSSKAESLNLENQNYTKEAV